MDEWGWAAVFSILKTDTQLKYLWYRSKKAYFRLEYAFYVVAPTPHPLRRGFLIRCNRKTLPGKAWWVWGPIYEQMYGRKNATAHLRELNHYWKYMPKTTKSTPVAEIRARQRQSLESALFNPVTPATRTLPFVRPVFMRVSTWASNQLIAG